MSLILFLHGPSSSGKSTLAAELRRQSPRPFLHLSIDHLRGSGAWRQVDYPDWQAARPAFFDGFHRAVAGFADAGNDLIIEHILDTPGWHSQLQDLLAGHQMLFVGLRPSLAALHQREQRRGDRPRGSAVQDAAHVHAGMRYDLDCDGTRDTEQLARDILTRINQPLPASGFFR
ncbi:MULTISPECIES: chloramphenicol phosphotransferase CPT family protein [unclassified Phaeobacter]|uniref:chloramphenicol phosphotransferase CPT family protein n=1 Tax=unclassified Phaeobacter TaxID=2621772 RepID=UPI003A8BA5F9